MRRAMDEEFGREQESAPDPGERVTFWRWLWRMLRPREKDLYRRYADRLRALDDAVAIHPQAASNYVLRGEIYLKLQEYALAIHDFERACAIVNKQIKEDDWGLVAQSLQDRALDGLKIASQHMPERLNDPVEHDNDAGSIGEVTDFDARV